MEKNTVLIIEPRIPIFLPKIINQYYNLLGGSNWNWVFYCGKGTTEYWKSIFKGKILEIRELDVDNFKNPCEYSDFCKTRELWNSLYGKYILTIQLDTWPMSLEPYTIDYFIGLDKSYIGGNFNYKFYELEREGICSKYYNYNGGLSLRNRLDMIKIIDSFPPLKTLHYTQDDKLSTQMETDAEDVYFVIGCYRLGLNIGDDEECSHFSIQYIMKESFFGIHQPHETIKAELNKKYPTLKDIQTHLCL